MQEDYNLLHKDKKKIPMRFPPLYQGIFLMIAGIFLYSLSDVIVKLLSDRYSAFHIIFMRSTFALPLIFLLHIRKHSIARIFQVNIREQLIRNAFLSLASILSIYSLSLIPLAEYAVFIYGAPLLVILLSRPILGEAITKKNVFCTSIGFFGVIISFNPSIQYVVHMGAVIACVAAFSYALGMILTSLQGRTTPPLVMVFWNTLSCALVGLCGTLFVPLTLDVKDLIYFVIEALIHVSSSLMIVRSFQLTPISLTSSLNYTAIIWATLFDYLIWKQTPQPHLILGAACILGCGMQYLYGVRLKKQEKIAHET